MAFLVNAIALVAMRASGQEIVLKPNALWLLALAGVAASGVDIFGLLAYERGLRVTSSVIIGGTSTALVLLVGVRRSAGAADGSSLAGDRPDRVRDPAAPGPGRMTASYRIVVGDGRSTEELVAAGRYGYAHSCVNSENFPVRPGRRRAADRDRRDHAAGGGEGRPRGRDRTALPAAPALDDAAVRSAMEQVLMEWQTALHENVQQSQQALRKLLAGRLVFTPDRDGGWSFTAEGRLEAVVAGRLPGLPTSVVSPTGFEPVFPD